jgi:O-antigen ligase
MQLITQAPIAGLLAASAYVATGGVVPLRWLGLGMIAAAAASLMTCEDLEFARARWAGWSLMLVAVGPVSNAPRAREFRRSLMEIVLAAIVAVTLISAAWWIVGLPNMGRGDFTGIMWHSMTLGPLAALAGLTALSRAMSRGSLAWLGVFAASAGVATLAASRSALAGMALGALILAALKLKRRPLISAVVLAAGLVMGVAPDFSLGILSGVLPENVTAGLMRKSWEHTREAQWDARWEEFLYSPATGVGFASGWEDTAGYNEETGAIETGSSYLSILSMTGVFGAWAFLMLVISAGLRTLKVWRRLEERQKSEIACFAGFWAVHLGAEGYIYGVGSLMGLTFWLWLGRLCDQLDAASRSSPWRVGAAALAPSATGDLARGGRLA